eukprot:scaffold77016_cov60-Phaeocystis_antarctica.AAC.2
MASCACFSSSYSTRPYPLTNPVRRSRLRWRFLMSPKSQNLSWMSSSCVSSCRPVRMISHPSTAARARTGRAWPSGVWGQGWGGVGWMARVGPRAAGSASTLHAQSCGRAQVGRACGGRELTFLRPLDAAALLYRLKLTALLHRRRRALSTPPLQPALGSGLGLRVRVGARVEIGAGSRCAMWKTAAHALVPSCCQHAGVGTGDRGTGGDLRPVASRPFLPPPEAAPAVSSMGASPSSTASSKSTSSSAMLRPCALRGDGERARRMWGEVRGCGRRS